MFSTTPPFRVPIYPSRTLDFLDPFGGCRALDAKGYVAKRNDGKKQDREQPKSLPSLPQKPLQQPNENPGDSLRLNVAVVGGGIGGLSAAIALAIKGHTVTVYERTQSLTELGAGIQFPPNATRLLASWGVLSKLSTIAVAPESSIIRRWQDGSVIGRADWGPEFRSSYGGPYLLLHRGQFQKALLDRALELGVKIQTGKKVVGYEFEVGEINGGPAAASIYFSNETMNGDTSVRADLVVAVDGVHSTARKALLGGIDQPPHTMGLIAFRAKLDVSQMKRDPELAAILRKPGPQLWVGHNTHAMTYPIAGGELFNMAMTRVDESDPETWRKETVMDEIKETFHGWDPTLHKMIGLIEEASKWKILTTGDALPRWVAPGGRLLIMGDAAHTMLPYMSQGGSTAIEDAGALAETLSHVSNAPQLEPALRIFEKVRIERTSQMVQASFNGGAIIHLPDGPEQRARDEAMKPEIIEGGPPFDQSPNPWNDPITKRCAYAYDAVGEMRKALSEEGF